jgi:hypothetical protein
VSMTLDLEGNALAIPKSKRQSRRTSKLST